MSLMISSRWLTKDTSSWRSSCSLCCCVDDFCQSAAETRESSSVHVGGPGAGEGRAVAGLAAVVLYLQHAQLLVMTMSLSGTDRRTMSDGSNRREMLSASKPSNA
ncbi:hypothetical protein EYF80_025504 [Liparis tanakae]|uniref:Uncharacterized protein n=1 Tax=Liparis tanakae TaxID=230148 RepID=A0A4Z2HH17_9TELE|nr:hypothetical protein EYF80_025504 [Liparis tanakae]